MGHQSGLGTRAAFHFARVSESEPQGENLTFVKVGVVVGQGDL